MNEAILSARRVCIGAFAMLALASASAAPAAVAQPSGASGREDAARAASAACLDGASLQDRQSCLKEVAAAQAEARRGRLGNGEDAETLARNALRRCEAVRPEERNACERMARGEGEVSGSVTGGGLLKSITTPVEAPVSSPAAAPAR